MILGIPSRPGLRVMVASKPVDFRKGMDGLASMVTQELLADPFAGDVFIFRSKRTDRIKLILWDGSGLCLVTKRLEAGGFTWPPVQDGAVALSVAQLRMLFDHAC
jgi:transposase